jgi:hypothetical protein
MEWCLQEPASLTAETPKVGDKAKSQHEVFISQVAADDQITERNAGRRYTVRLKVDYSKEPIQRQSWRQRAL